MSTQPLEDTFYIREMKRCDIEALLAFEIENREWFESHIEARAAAFYSLQGVGSHIDEYLCAMAAGTWHPFVIEDHSARIVGRANLKNINTAPNTAEVGYRVARNAGGQGLATLALRHLIQQARERWRLTQLIAFVYTANVGSAKVLDRCGFSLAASDESPSCGERRFIRSL